MKGQMFIIAALVMIVVMVSLRSNLSLANVLENQRHLVSSFDTLEFSNIRSEMVRTLYISYNSTANMTNNLNNFNSFVRDVMTAKSVEFDSLIEKTYYTNLTANQNTTVTVNVLNSLGKDMQFLNLTFNGTSQTFSLANQNVLQTTFAVNTSVTINQTLTVFYNTTSTNQTETITIPLVIGGSKYVTFFDLRYISANGQQSDKFTNTISLV
jgi:hypothetical protein